MNNTVPCNFWIDLCPKTNWCENSRKLNQCNETLLQKNLTCSTNKFGCCEWLNEGLKKHDSLIGKRIPCCHHRNVVHANAKHQQCNDNGYWQ